MLHPEPAWIDPSGVLKYTLSADAIIFFCQVYETAGFNRQHIGSRGLEVYFFFVWPCHTLVFSPGELPIYYSPAVLMYPQLLHISNLLTVRFLFQPHHEFDD